MAIPTKEQWILKTKKLASKRDGSIKVIDDALENYGKNKTRAELLKLRDSIEKFQVVKTTKHGNYRKSKREGDDGNITWLADEVKNELLKLGRDNGQAIATNVCGKLFDVKIADVDFSENVRDASKAKKLGKKSVYEIVKSEWDIEGNEEDYAEHERSLTLAKLKTALPFGPRTIPLSELNKIAAVVKKHRFAVCESITATIISDCAAGGFTGILEWVGIPYTASSGHSIVIANRDGDIRKPDTWGESCFIVDLWYYNLGMRPQYLLSENNGTLSGYIEKDITPYLAVRGGPKIMASIKCN